MKKTKQKSSQFLVYSFTFVVNKFYLKSNLLKFQYGTSSLALPQLKVGRN